MADGYWAIVTYEAGAVGEKVKYWIPGEVPPRSIRKRRSDLRKIRQNETTLSAVWRGSSTRISRQDADLPWS